jgi:predicted transcriptional regulator
MVRQESEVFFAALEYSRGKGMSQIITLMQFRWSKRRKETRNRDGEIAKAVMLTVLQTGLLKKGTKMTEEGRSYFMYKTILERFEG